MEQIPFPFTLETAFIFANFYDPKSQIIPVLEDSIKYSKLIHVVGTTGKTHLLQASCNLANTQGKRVSYIPMKQFVDLPTGALEFDTQFEVLCVDDIDAACGKPEWELKLFNLFNGVQDRQQTLIISSTQLDLSFSLLDLASRLKLLSVVKLNKIDDTTQALLLHAVSRGLFLDEAVIKYMQYHLPRNINYLVSLLDKLEITSLIDKRKISVALLKEVTLKP